MRSEKKTMNRIASISGWLEERPLFSEEERVSRAIGYLRETGNYEVLGQRANGFLIATTRDMLKVRNPQTTRLVNLFRLVPQIGPGDDLGTAARLMFDYRLRALPVRLAGKAHVDVVSVPGILRQIPHANVAGVAISKIMTPSPIMVQSSDTASKARSIMIRREIDHLPVLKEGKLAGIVTSSHLLFNLLPSARVPSRAGVVRSGIEKVTRFDYPVANISDESVLAVQVNTSVPDAIDSMLRGRSTYALVLQDEEIQGIVTLRDVMKLLLRRERKSSPYYIVGLPDKPFEAEAARNKFERLANHVSRALPSVREIRAVIKNKETGSDRSRYEVKVAIYLPGRTYSYSQDGHDLADVFGLLSSRVKRILGSKQSRVTETKGGNLRKRTSSERER